MAVSCNRNWCKWTQPQKYWLRIKRQKSVEHELGCKFIRTDPDKEDFNILKAINKIFWHMKQSTKKNSNK